MYILTNEHHTTLYIGVTSDLKVRLREHLDKKYPKSFTAKYNLNKLIFVEHYATIDEAIQREKQLKKKKRANKDKLIDDQNPKWKDFSKEVLEW